MRPSSRYDFNQGYKTQQVQEGTEKGDQALATHSDCKKLTVLHDRLAVQKTKVITASREEDGCSEISSEPSTQPYRSLDS